MNTIEDAIIHLSKLLSTITVTSAPTSAKSLSKSSNGRSSAIPRTNSGGIAMTAWEEKFISSVSERILLKQALTTSQVDASAKIILKYKGIHQSFESIGKSKHTRLDPTLSVSVKREVRYAGASFLVFRYPFSDDINESMRALSFSYGQNRIVRNSLLKTTLLEVDPSNYSQIMKIIRKYNFDFDEDVLMLFSVFMENKNTHVSITEDEDNYLVDVGNNNQVLNWLSNKAWLFTDG